MKKVKRKAVVEKICGYLKDQQEIARNLTEMIHLAEEGLQEGEIDRIEELRDFLLFLDDMRQIKENNFKQTIQEFRPEVTMATGEEAIPVTTEI